MEPYQLLYNIMMLRLQEAINEAYKNKIKETYGEKRNEGRDRKE